MLRKDIMFPMKEGTFELSKVLIVPMPWVRSVLPFRVFFPFICMEHPIKSYFPKLNELSAMASFVLKTLINWPYLYLIIHKNGRLRLSKKKRLAQLRKR